LQITQIRKKDFLGLEIKDRDFPQITLIRQITQIRKKDFLGLEIKDRDFPQITRFLLRT